MKNRTHINNLQSHIGSRVNIQGWVHVRRDQGKMVFLVLRDQSGMVQCVVLPDNQQAQKDAHKLRSEWVVSVSGIVNERPEKMKRSDEHNGDIEIAIDEITILNTAETTPFEIAEDTRGINEDVRLEYRYLDLRTERMQRNLRMRHRTLKFIRDYLDDAGFYEIETPILTKSTQEGARDYVVPSRLWHGQFYALPQAPQQYKQLLMASGIERYFQVAKCMRDEDTRGDRQPEFTQIDMEMSFVDRDEVMQANEALLIALVGALYPEKNIQETPFPVMTYKQAMDQYGTDRPDIRKDKTDPHTLAFCWIVDFPFFEKTKESDNPDATGEWTFTHNPFSAPKKEHENDLMQKQNIGDILTTQYDIVLNGSEIGGGSIRSHTPDTLRSVLEIIGFGKNEIAENFGHMLTALSFGAPPHGGIAWGFDRLLMILQNEPNIREIIAFPKTGEGKDLMMDAPAPISNHHLKELGLSLRDDTQE